MTTSDSVPFSWDNAFREFSRQVKVLERTYGRASKYRSYAKTRAVTRGKGDPYSQHGGALPVPLAGDFTIGPEQYPQFARDARAAGLTPVDETRMTLGTGPHAHVQYLPAGLLRSREWSLATAAVSPFEETP